MLNRRRAVLERYCGATFEAERLARLVRRSGLPVEHLAQRHGLLDQLGIRLRALLAADTEVVFQADPDVSTEHHAHRGEVVLGGVADAGRRPGVVVAEEL